MANKCTMSATFLFPLCRIQTTICLKEVKSIIACVVGVKRRGKGGEERSLPNPSPFLPASPLKI